MQKPDEKITILSPPVLVAGREVYPVVHLHAWKGDKGGMIYAKPCALLIREDDSWFFVPVDDDTGK
jgi:hypothetical protein